MNATERRAEIFNLLQKDGSADLNELAEKLAVSSMTVRRDLQIFEHQGLVTIDYGRAYLDRNVSHEPSFTVKAGHMVNEKLRIGKAAADMVEDGDTILIDCGTTEVLIDGGDNGAGAAVAAYLAAYVDGPLDYLIATHPDADHIGGLDEVLAAYPVGEVIDSGRTSDTKTYADYWAAVQAEGCTLSYDEDRILPLSDNTVLSLLETGDAWGDSNACSVVAQLTCGNVQVLFTGDMTAQVEAAALPLFGDIDVLKVAHHGSASSTSQAFLDVVRPECAVISYGQGNRYGHPTAQVLQRLLGQGISVYGTGKSGPIVLTTDGTTYSFNTSVTLTAHDAPSP